MKPLESPPAKIVHSNVSRNILSEENCVSVNPEAGYQDGSPSATGSLKRSYGNEHLKYGSPIRNMQNKQEPASQSQTVADNDGTDDLVDVCSIEFFFPPFFTSNAVVYLFCWAIFSSAVPLTLLFGNSCCQWTLKSHRVIKGIAPGGSDLEVALMCFI